MFSKHLLYADTAPGLSLPVINTGFSPWGMGTTGHLYMPGECEKLLLLSVKGVGSKSVRHGSIGFFSFLWMNVT